MRTERQHWQHDAQMSTRLGFRRLVVSVLQRYAIPPAHGSRLTTKLFFEVLCTSMTLVGYSCLLSSHLSSAPHENTS